MFKEEWELVTFFAGVLKNMFVIFVLFPLLFILLVMGFVTGAIWQYLAIFLAGLAILLVIERIIFFFLNKNIEKKLKAEQAKKAEEEKVKYIIIK